MSLSLDPTVELDLDALCARAAQLLEHAGADTADGRVRERPDPRTVRYYQTLGLLDRPLRYDGRRALYSHRHLMQVVAVKCLQARGLSLAQAQQALADEVSVAAGTWHDVLAINPHDLQRVTNGAVINLKREKGIR
jgi:hypothetical protein